jgi:hypothetical protein
MKSCKRYILVVLDEELAKKNQNKEEENGERDTNLFEMRIDKFDEKSEIQILDTWSLSVVSVPLDSPVSVSFVQRLLDTLSILTKRNQLLMINISMLNTNSHMKISEDLKMNSLKEQINNIFQYCGTSICLEPVLSFVQDMVFDIQKMLKLRR